MALTGLSYSYIGAGGLNIIVLGIFVILLFRNFLKKRTIGTSLLILTYSNLLVNEILATGAFLLESFNVGDPQIQLYCKIMQIIGIMLLVFTINWFYFFGNRHLIKDNDLFKSIYTSVFGVVVGACMGLAIQDIITKSSTEALWYTEIYLEGVDFHLYYPAADITKPYIFMTGGLFLIGSYTYIRLSLRTYQLQRKAKDIVTKKGFKVITASILLMLFTGLSLGFYIFGAGKNGYVSAILYIIRGLIVLSAVFTGYIGWIMPEWVRKRFRGKAWIAKIYTGKLNVPPDSPGNIQTGSSSQQIVEVSDT
ncbi:MAG: hypothetical protein JXA54_12735 [Candidatus Heimdallarchaeota archaeon]|nr:hypothetical protein [Candidatus Heimdallarchaeota archaeon]